MLALGWFIFKAWALLILLALSGKGVGFVSCMVVENSPTVRRFRWLAWGFVAAGIVVIVAATCKLLLLIFA